MRTDQLLSLDLDVRWAFADLSFSESRQAILRQRIFNSLMAFLIQCCYACLSLRIFFQDTQPSATVDFGIPNARAVALTDLPVPRNSKHLETQLVAVSSSRFLHTVLYHKLPFEIFKVKTGKVFYELVVVFLGYLYSIVLDSCLL